jgi:HEAT repeat protein
VGDRFTVIAKDVSRNNILNEFARVAELEVTNAEEDEPVTVKARALDLREVIPMILQGQVYEVHFVPASDEAHVLSGVTVVGPEYRKETQALLQERRAARRAQNRAKEGRASPNAGELLRSADPEERAEALGQLGNDDVAAARLGEILATDSDPRVRALAATHLGFTDSVGGVQSLVRALGDREPAVVLAALEALAFVGDRSVVGAIEPLLEHPDPKVSEQAAAMIEFLE